MTPSQKDDQPETPDYLLDEFSGAYQGEIAGYKCFWAMRWPHMDLVDDLYDVFYDPDGSDSNECDHVDSTMTIRWNGDVVACCYDLTSELVMGNVRESSLGTIWNDSRYLTLRQSIESSRFVDLCANCYVVRPNAYLLLKSAHERSGPAAEVVSVLPARRPSA